MIYFIFGLFVGGFIGCVGMALAVAAGEDEHHELPGESIRIDYIGAGELTELIERQKWMEAEKRLGEYDDATHSSEDL